ncbi:hypothetical protein GmHk_18G052218 [Glycine max]|nr:hypothetical protein GmHk_18G052218 [Glycine max]
MTRARARKAKEALQQVLSILFEYKPKFQGEKSKVEKWARLVKCRIYELAKPRHVLGEPSAKPTILQLSAQKNLEEG